MKPYEINAAVAAQLSSAGTKVVSTVVERLAQAEVEKRAVALQKAVELAARVHSKIRSLEKASNKTYDLEGRMVSEFFTQAQLKEIKTLREKSAKIERAVERATAETPDYSELFNLKDEPDAPAGKSEEAGG